MKEQENRGQQADWKVSDIRGGGQGFGGQGWIMYSVLLLTKSSGRVLMF